MLSLKDFQKDYWQPSIIKTVATENKGIIEVASEIYRHKCFLEKDNGLLIKRERNTQLRIKEIVETILRQDIWNNNRNDILLNEISEVVKGNLSPYSLAEKIVNSFNSSE